MSELRRFATIHPTVFVAPGAVVLGDVTLGPRASVWFNTVVRGDSAEVVVGEDTNLQDNSVVHEDEGYPALIGARVTVGHRSIIHGCVIEDDCLIGMGSVILSGARIGAGSLVGAASLVREGQIIPPESLVVGSPARVVGPVGPAHRASIRNGAAHYAELARAYMRRGLARGADAGGAVTRDHAPMSRREWDALISDLAAAPSRVAARLGGADAAALVVRIAGWASTDRDLRLPLLEAAERGEEPIRLAPAEPNGVAEALDRAMDAWREARSRLCGRLASLGPAGWNQLAGHPTRGAFLLADVVREWVEEDHEHRLEIEALVGGGA
jgi:carbonic anhydrase/acetyltransferase-like protein (isoleucine patch superfamily)